MKKSLKKGGQKSLKKVPENDHVSTSDQPGTVEQKS